MKSSIHPAFAALLEAFEAEFVFCQVFMARVDRGFSLRHSEDRALSAASLRLVAVGDLRALAQYTDAGAFRPLKSAPNLQRGWRVEPRDEVELWSALSALYPGGVVDWFAAQSPHPPVTGYREFTARQTGMYRIAAALPDEPARAAILACCHRDSCWKRRLWSMDGLPPDEPGEKSVLPCLEPCAVMLEFARKVARWEQGVDAPAVSESVEEVAAECDFDSPANPRRRRFLLEKQRRAATSPV
jgi:hypothetical protein